MADLDQARAAKVRLRSVLSQHHGIRGIGVTRDADGYGLQVNLESPQTEDVPGAVDGVPVHVRVVGAITPQR